MKYILLFSALGALVLFLVGVYVVRWRRGVKGPRIKNEDYGSGCCLVTLLTAPAVFLVGWLALDWSWWVAALAGGGGALFVGFELGIHMPSSEEEPTSNERG